MRLKNRGIVFLFLILLALSSCESNSNSSNSVSLNNLSVKENVIVNKDPKALATANKFQNAVRHIAKKVLPAVVDIRAERKVSNFKFPYDPFKFRDEKFFNRFFDDETPKTNQKSISVGSGFIFSKEGYIITNDHVIDGATNITVILNNLKEYKATVVGRDPISDLSIIKINYGKDIPVVSFGDSSKIDIGNIVIAIGNPFGLSNSLTFGVVSAKGRTDIDKNASFKHFIQTDASINQGNSGGPLIDLNGNVIGVNTQILSTAGKGSIGIGFAIPINITKQIIKQLIIKGKVERGYIGAIVGPIPKEIAKYFKIEDKAGIFVNDILPNGPAYKAGLKPGDIILSINNQSVKTTAELIGLISEIHPNHPAKINILRNGKKQLLTIFVANRPNEVVLNNNLNEETKKNDWLGITLGLSNSKKNNNIQSPIVVKDININSPAFNKLRVGDIVESINYKPINSLSTLNKVIREEKNKKSFLFVVIRKGRRLFFVIDDN